MSATLTVCPYQALEAEIRPERAAGRRSAKFAFAVRNTANAPVDVDLAVTAPDEACQFAIAQPRVSAQPGHRGGSEFTVTPRKQIWVGRPLDHPFGITATAAGSQTAATRQAVFRQRPWLPWWAPIAVVLAVAAGVLGWKETHQPAQPKVPNLIGLPAAAAQSILEKHDLLLAPGTEPTQPVGQGQVGKIVKQDPGPNHSVAKNTPVTITVGIGSQQTTVPNVCGQPLSQAEQTLAGNNLAVGAVQPATAAPTDMTLASGCTVPAADPTKQVAYGTPVTVFVQSSATGGGGGAGGAAGTALTSFVGMQVATAKSAHHDAGAHRRDGAGAERRVGSGRSSARRPASGRCSAPAGRCSCTSPPIRASRTTPGRRPTSRRSSLASGTTDYTADRRPTTAGSTNIEPSWSPDGKLIAYVNRVTSAGDGGRHRPHRRHRQVDRHGGRRRRRRHAPAGVRAVERPSPARLHQPRPAGSGWQPCFVDLDKPLPEAEWCAPADHLRRPRPADLVARRPGGAVPGREHCRRTARRPARIHGPASRSPSRGQVDREQRPPSCPDGPMYFVAWSPDGSTIALSSTGPPGQPRDQRRPVHDHTDGDAPGHGQSRRHHRPTPAAELAWRSDGKLVVSSLGCETAQATGPLVLVDPLNPAVAQPPLTVTGCDPAVEPLPPPPPPG